MKQIYLKSLLLMLLMCVGMGAWAEEVTWTASKAGYSNATSVADVELNSNISLKFEKGTNSNTPKYYTSGTAVRAYGGNTITLNATNATITGVTFTFGSDDGSNAITANGESFTSPNWTGSANAVTFTIGGTTGNRRISAIKVTYTTSGGESIPEPTKYNITIANNIANGTVTANPTTAAEGATVTLTATPAAGYEFVSWNVTDASSNSITVTDNKFKMPAANVNVSATFNKIPTFDGTVTTMSAANDADIKFVTGSSSTEGAVWANSTPLTANNVTLSGSVTSGTNYSYYDGSVVRFYTNNNLVVTPLNGATIVKVEIVRQSTTTNNNGTINCSGLTASTANTTTNTNVFTGSATSAVTFTNTAQSRFTKIIVYTTGGSDPLEPISHSVTWSVNGEMTTTSVAENSAIKFENPETTSINGKMFVGWVDTEIEGTTDTAPTFVTSATMGGNDVTYYAVFADGGDEWKRITALVDITNGTYVIKSSAYVLPNEKNTSTGPLVLDAPTINDGLIIGDVLESMKWFFASTGETDKFFIKNANGDFLYETNNNNGIRIGSTSDRWQFTDNGKGYFSIKGDNNNRYCGVYNEQDWRSYESATHTNYENGGKIEVYKYVTSYSNYCTTVPEALQTSISSAGYATFVPSKSVTVPSGVTAYAVKIDGEKAKLTPVDAIPANKAVVLKGGEGTYYFPEIESADGIDTDLQASANNVTASGSQYILANGEDGIGFYQATPNTTIAAGKAYLEISGTSVKAITFEEVTAIDAVATTDAKAAIYNLRGQRVSADYKGIVIKNGKKYLNK